MPLTSPFCLTQISVNSGAAATGTQTVAGGSTIQLSLTNGSLITDVRWEIFAYPPSWPTPSGWTLDATTGIIYSTDTTPSLITLEPASTRWGKWLVRAIGNGGTKNGVAPVQDPVTGSYLPNDVVDITAGWQVLEPNTGATDIALFEGTQFGDLLRWVKGLQTAIRAIIAFITGAVQALFGPPKAQAASGVERLTTTSTTPVSASGAAVYALADETHVDCVMTVVAKLSGGNTIWTQDYYVNYYRHSAGAPTISGSVGTGGRTLPTTLTGVSATWVVSGNNLVPQVTDATGSRTINWSITAQYQPVTD